MGACGGCWHPSAAVFVFCIGASSRVPSLAHRWVPSQADVVVCKAVGTPPKDTFVHALRWFRHISSYSENDQQRCVLRFRSATGAYSRAVVLNSLDDIFRGCLDKVGNVLSDWSS